MSDEYEHVVVENLPDAPNPTRHKKEVDEAVGATEFGFNLIVADPGEQVPWGYHYHPNHEELLYVLEGYLTVETAEGEHRVDAGEAFFVPAGAPQRAVAGEDGCRLVAAGAPKAADGAVLEEECPECNAATDRDFAVEETDETTVYVLSCQACGAETDRLTPGPS
ncbi:cupin domain-containing protein [Halosegnis sp.]|uniref:cupin domain-containing protein n=1 Tax=Halosegnis sp. TaxID=2864959 RepID=UPI0035D464E3